MNSKKYIHLIFAAAILISTGLYGCKDCLTCFNAGLTYACGNGMDTIHISTLTSNLNTYIDSGYSCVILGPPFNTENGSTKVCGKDAVNSAQASGKYCEQE